MKKLGFLVSQLYKAIAITIFIYAIKYDALSMLKLWLRTWSPSKLTNRINGFEPIVYLS